MCKSAEMNAVFTTSQSDSGKNRNSYVLRAPKGAEVLRESEMSESVGNVVACHFGGVAGSEFFYKIGLAGRPPGRKRHVKIRDD